MIEQILGFLAMFCFVASFQIKSNKALYILQIAGSLLFGLQYLMMGGYTGCINIVIVILRNILIINFGRWAFAHWKGWVYIIIGAATAVMVITWQGVESIFPYTALVGGTIGYWTDNAQKIRLANLVCSSPSWLIYDIIMGSWGGIINEIIALSSIIISVIRYGWKNMGDNRFGE